MKKDNLENKNDVAFSIPDKYPVSNGHKLILPQRHIAEYWSLSQLELIGINDLIKVCKAELMEKDRTITGFNIGINNGISAGQTIDHVHVHLIPRRKGDVDNPSGGIRVVIPDKKHY